MIGIASLQSGYGMTETIYIAEDYLMRRFPTWSKIQLKLVIDALRISCDLTLNSYREVFVTISYIDEPSPMMYRYRFASFFIPRAIEKEPSVMYHIFLEYIIQDKIQCGSCW